MKLHNLFLNATEIIHRHQLLTVFHKQRHNATLSQWPLHTWTRPTPTTEGEPLFPATGF